MKNVMIFFLIILAGCYTAKQAAEDAAKKKQTNSKTVYFNYEYKIISPTENDKMSYNDSVIFAKFDITHDEIDFTIENKTQKPIKIIWDNASMAILGESKKIMHKGIKYNERNSLMSPTVILPNTILSDLALPTENIYFKEGYTGSLTSTPSSWEKRPLFISSMSRKKYDSSILQDLKGRQITLFLPITDLSGKDYGYTFKFQIENVTAK